MLFAFFARPRVVLLGVREDALDVFDLVDDDDALESFVVEEDVAPSPDDDDGEIGAALASAALSASLVRASTSALASPPTPSVQ